MKLWWAKLPNKWKAALHSAWIAASASFLPQLFGFLADVQKWAGDTNGKFPAVSPLGKAAGALLVGVIGGVVGFIFRTITPPPAYPSTEVQVVPPAVVPKDGDGGYGLLVTILIVLAIILAILLILAHVDFTTH